MVFSKRKASIKQFEDLVRKFEARGRHRFYLTLFHTVSLSGFRGLVVRAIKNEVAAELDGKVCMQCCPSCYHLDDFTQITRCGHLKDQVIIGSL